MGSGKVCKDLFHPGPGGVPRERYWMLESKPWASRVAGGMCNLLKRQRQDMTLGA